MVPSTPVPIVWRMSLSATPDFSLATLTATRKWMSDERYRAGSRTYLTA